MEVVEDRGGYEREWRVHHRFNYIYDLYYTSWTVVRNMFLENNSNCSEIK